MSGIGNTIMGYTERAVSQLASTRVGIVTSYNPDDFTAKVQYDDWDEPSDWLPIMALAANDSVSVRAAIEVGMHVFLIPQEADSDSYIIFGAVHSELKPPVNAAGDIDGEPEPTKAGEFSMVMKGGGSLKFNDDGSVFVQSPTELRFQAPDIKSKGAWAHEGNITVTSGDVTADGKSLKAHKHGGVQTGGGQTGTPV